MLTYLLKGEPAEGVTGVQFALNHALDHDHVTLAGGITISSFKIMIAVAAALMLLFSMKADKKSLVPRGICRNALEGILLFIRGMTRSAHLPDKFVPFFCTTFFFILTMNLLGMVPIPKYGGTATSNMMVTGALASIIITVSVLAGFIYQGPGGFLKLFVPSGLPVALVPVLFVLEFVGFFIKHGVLMVRLFANMIAGHLVIGAFLGLIPDMHSYVVAGLLSVPLSLFVACLELLVAFLQAYVFTLLSVLFIGGMVHADH